MSVVGVPREIKSDEYRVAMLPVGVEELTRRGHRVLIESGAGVGSGITDQQYQDQGAEIVPDAAAVFSQAELVVKVKEPLPSEWPLIHSGQIVFTYFHFAANAELTRAMLETGATAVAYERFAFTDSNERSGGTNEYPGRSKVPGTASGRTRHSARRSSRSAARSYRDSGRRSCR